MYKTVRQGENSLQYTILPQTEEVLTNSGIKGKGRDYSPTNQVRVNTKRLTLYYIGLFLFGLFLISSGILVVLILTGVFPLDVPSKIISKHQALTANGGNCTPKGFEKAISRKKELSSVKPSDIADNITILPLLANLTITQVQDNTSSPILETTESISVQTVSASPYHEPVSKSDWIIPALKKQQSFTTTVTPGVSTESGKGTTPASDKQSTPLSHQRESNNDLMLGHDPLSSDYDDEDDDEDYDLTKAPTTSIVYTKKPPLMISKLLPKPMGTKEIQPLTTTISTIDASATTQSQNISSATKDPKAKNKTKMDAVMFGEMKENILDDDDEDYKEPSTDEEDVSEQTTGDDVKMSQAKSSWLQTRWPFVDPSSYFQWTDYSARDNLLLPAILSAALSALLVLAVLCYALRRRQRCKRRIQEIGNLTSDLQAEDNAVLLTAENPSEED